MSLEMRSLGKIIGPGRLVGCGQTSMIRSHRLGGDSLRCETKLLRTPEIYLKDSGSY